MSTIKKIGGDKAIWIVVIALCILLVLAVRQIPVQYARRSVAGSGPSRVYSKRQYIPLRLNASRWMGTYLYSKLLLNFFFENNFSPGSKSNGIEDKYSILFSSNHLITSLRVCWLSDGFSY